MRGSEISQVQARMTKEKEARRKKEAPTSAVLLCRHDQSLVRTQLGFASYSITTTIPPVFLRLPTMASPIATSSRAMLGGAPRLLSRNAVRSLSSAAPSTTNTTSAGAGAGASTQVPPPSDSDSVNVQERRRLSRTMMSQLSGLGSEQTRQNSFRPHKLRLDPVDARRITLGHLVASGAQMGHTLSSLRQAHQPHIYGVRHGVAVFDLERATLPALKRAASVVRAVAERDGVILFVGTRPGQQASVLAATKRMSGNAFHVTAERWMPGVITNAPKLLAPAILKSMKGEDQVPNTNRLASQTLQPDLVIVLNPLENSYAIREATQANIPTIAITDSDVDPRSVTYAIPANDDSMRTVELVIGVLSKAGQEGLRSRDRLLDENDKAQRKANRRLGNSQQTSTNFDPRNRGKRRSFNFNNDEADA